MTKKTFYKIFLKEKIIIEYFSGKSQWSDLVELKKKETDELNYNPDFNVITDIRNAKLDMEDLNEISKYLDFLHNNSKSIGNRRTAVITDSSEHVIHSELLRVKKNNLPIDLKSVSTLKAAYEWVRIDGDARNKITKVLNELDSEVLLPGGNR